MHSSEKVSISHKQFSEIVREAEGDEVKDDKTAYVFSNGRRFDGGPGPYEPAA
jgi:hypothetical protein